ncbi:predicted protein [Postia placenta Mad-698-R]|nr:predicted protein [Postia placenta Mad-698-R]
MKQIRLEWSIIWEILGEHFNQAMGMFASLRVYSRDHLSDLFLLSNVLDIPVSYWPTHDPSSCNCAKKAVRKSEFNSNSNVVAMKSKPLLETVLYTLLSLFRFIDAFESLYIDKSQHRSLCVIEGFPKLGTLDIVLGSIYAAICGMYIFGIMAVSLNELIDECTKIAQSDTDFKRFVFWGPTFETKLNQSEASTHCHNDWNLRSSIEITIFILDAPLVLAPLTHLLIPLQSGLP